MWIWTNPTPALLTLTWWCHGCCESTQWQLKDRISAQYNNKSAWTILNIGQTLCRPTRCSIFLCIIWAVYSLKSWIRTLNVSVIMSNIQHAHEAKYFAADVWSQFSPSELQKAGSSIILIQELVCSVFAILISDSRTVGEDRVWKRRDGTGECYFWVVRGVHCCNFYHIIPQNADNTHRAQRPPGSVPLIIHTQIGLWGLSMHILCTLLNLLGLILYINPWVIMLVF